MLSVIIPTFNRAHLLTRALHSVFAQSMPCDELIVVDDGSQDGTAALLKQIKRQSPLPLHIIYQKNRGAAAARNAGLELAQGDYVAFLDDDDWWLPHKLMQQRTALQCQPQYPIAHTREIWYRRGQRVNQKKKHDPPDDDIFVRSLGFCVVGMSTVMAKRELFQRYGGFDESLPCCEDYDLWLRLARQESFLLVPTALTVKDGGRSDQLSAIHRMGMDQYRISSLKKLVDSKSLNPAQDAAARRELAHKCILYGRGCSKHGRHDEGNKYLDLAAQYQAQCQLPRPAHLSA